MSFSGLYAPAPRHPLPNMAGVMNPMSMHSASPPHPRPAMMNPAAVQLPPNPVVAPVASVNNWPTNTPAPTQPLPQQQGGGPPVNVVVTSSVRIPTSVDASPSPALAPVTIPREHLAKPVATEAATALATTSASTTPSRPHNYQINIPQNSPEAKDPFAGKEGPAVPITTSAILASIPAPKFSAVSSKTTTAASASPKPKMAVSASVTTSTTSSSSSQKSNNFGNQFKLKPGTPKAREEANKPPALLDIQVPPPPSTSHPPRLLSLLDIEVPRPPHLNNLRPQKSQKMQNRKR